MKPALEERLREALLPHPTRRKYLVGVSGGVDSVALLHVLAHAGYRRLVVCHLDHRLRGKASRTDAAWVERLAARWGLPFRLGRADVAALAKTAKTSVETAARSARYQFFGETARQERCRALFLAHQADDQVETLLFNLFRGAGSTGLRGMKAESSRSAEGAARRDGLRILRPWLGVWREEIEEYARRHKLRWRADASNNDPAYTRNRLRHEIIPLLEQSLGRGIRPALWRAADILGAEDDWLNDLLADDLPPEKHLRLPVLKMQPTAKQRRLVRAWLMGLGAPQIGYEEIERVRSLWLKPHLAAKINLPGGWHVRRRAGTIFAEAAPSNGPLQKPK